jgi:hypothetical protein
MCLDRTLRFLTPALLNSMDLPAELRFFGGDSRLEFEAIASAIRREVQHPDVDELRLYLGGRVTVGGQRAANPAVHRRSCAAFVGDSLEEHAGGYGRDFRGRGPGGTSRVSGA